MQDPLKVGIFGGCVSRDTIDPWLANGVELVRYIARQSLLSARSDATAYFPELTLESEFQQRMVEADLLGSLFEDIRKLDDLHLLIWDLNVERQGVWRMPDGSIATNSTELRKTPSYEEGVENATHLEFAEDCHQTQWKSAAMNFTALLTSMKLFERTVVLAPEWAQKDEAGKMTGRLSGVDAAGYNELFEPYWTTLEESGLDVIRITDTVADSKHKWGPGPFHYTEPVYEQLRSALWERIK